MRFVNPRLDGDREHNTIRDDVGVQAGLRFTPNSRNNEVIGGLLENMPQMGISANSHDLRVTGTKIENVGEHGIYVSGGEDCADATDIYLETVEVIHPGLNGYGYGFKMRSVRNGNVSDGHVVFSGDEEYSTIGIVYTDGSQGGTAELRVENATYGCQITERDRGIPIRGVSLSLDLRNCGSFVALPGNADDATGCRVFDSNVIIYLTKG